MSCYISLSDKSDEELILTTPGGRKLSVPVGPHSTQLLWQILWSAESGKEHANRAAPSYPTQAALNALAKQFDASRLEERKEKFEEKWGEIAEGLEIEL